MKKNTYNLLAKSDKKYSFLISDFIATKLNEKEFEIIKKNNEKLFKDYRFIPYNETDFTWWAKVNKYLTKNKLYSGVCFDIDYFGNITKY